MSKSVTVSTFAGLAPPWSLTNLDTNTSALAAALASANADATYAVDTGAVNAYVLALPTGITATLTPPLLVWWKVANTNTAGSTLTVAALSPQSILNPDGSALQAGQLVVGAVVATISDGTNFYLVGGGIPIGGFSANPVANSLSADVSITDSTNYFDGPSVAVGASGKFFASSTSSLKDSSSAGIYSAKLWDGTTLIASGTYTGNATNPGCMTLSGFITNPVGNLRMSVRCTNTTTSKIIFNGSGNSKDSTITAFRVA